MKFLLGLLGSTALIAGGTVPIAVMNLPTNQASEIIDNNLFLALDITDKDEEGNPIPFELTSTVETNGKQADERAFEFQWGVGELLPVDFKMWRKIDWKQSYIAFDASYSFKSSGDYSDDVEDNLFAEPIKLDKSSFAKKGADYTSEAAGDELRTITYYGEIALDVNFKGVNLRARTTTNVSGNPEDKELAKKASSTITMNYVYFDLYFK